MLHFAKYHFLPTFASHLWVQLERQGSAIFFPIRVRTFRSTKKSQGLRRQGFFKLVRPVQALLFCSLLRALSCSPLGAR